MLACVTDSLLDVKKWARKFTGRKSRKPGQNRPSSRTADRRLWLAVEMLETRLTPAASIIAASAFDSAVYRFDAATGDHLETLVSPDSPLLALPPADGTKAGPAGMTIGSDGNLYISSQANDKILKYDFATDTLSVFIDSDVLNPIAVNNGVNTGTFAPAGLRFGPDGNLFVSMNGGRQAVSGGAVVRFSVTDTGGVLSYGDSFSIVASGLVQPTGMAFGVLPGDFDTLYVSNSGVPQPNLPAAFTPANIIKITDADGTSPIQSTFIAKSPSQFVYPSGLVFNTSGELFVVDLFAHNVARYGSSGSFVGIFTTPADSLSFPSDALFDATGNMLATSLGHNFGQNMDGFISKFDASGVFVEQIVTSADFPTSPLPGFSGISPSQVALLNDSPTADVGGPYTLAEGDALVLDASASTDPDGDPLTYTWDINGDGVYCDATGVNPVIGWGLLQSLGIDDGPSTFSVKVRVTDSHSAAVTSTAATVTLTNTAPTATFSASTPVSPNTPVTATFGAAFDYSNTDTAAGFTYSFDFNNDGDFADPGDAADVTTSSRSFTYSGEGPHTIRGVIKDKDGGARTYFADITVANQPPTASAGPSLYSIVEGNDLILDASASTDPEGDGLIYSWDLNGDNDFSDASGVNPTMTWDTLKNLGIKDGPNTYTIKLKVDDGHGHISNATSTLQLDNKSPTINNAAITSDLHEGQTATLTGTLVEPGPLDTLRLTINWGDGSPLSIIDNLAPGTNFSETHQYLRDGNFTVTMIVKDKDNAQTSSTVSAVVQNLDIIVSAPIGSQSSVQVFNTGSLQSGPALTLTPYGANFQGGIRVAVGDVVGGTTGDNVPDIITVSRTGNKALKIYAGSSTSTDPVLVLRPFGHQRINGMFVTARDVNGDGRDELIVSTGGGVAGRVKVIDLNDPDNPIASFTPYGRGYRGAVAVAVGDVNGDGSLELVTSKGKSKKPEVNVFSLDGSQELYSFRTFAGSTGGINLAVGDLNGDQAEDIVVGGKNQPVLALQVLSPLNRLFDFRPYRDSNFKGAVQVGVADVNSDGALDLLTAPGATTGADTEIRAWQQTGDPQDPTLLDNLFASAGFQGGLSVAGGGWQA